MPVASCFRECHVAGSHSPQHIGLQYGVRDQVGKTAVDPIDIIAFNMVVDLAVNGVNHRGGKDADFNTRRMEIEPDGVERSAHVAPI